MHTGFRMDSPGQTTEFYSGVYVAESDSWLCLALPLQADKKKHKHQNLTVLSFSKNEE